jgi:hypothetical protein
MKGNSTMKKVFLLLSALTLLTLACDLSVTAAPSTGGTPLHTTTAIPATAVPSQISESATGVPATAVPSLIPPSPTLMPATAVPNPTATVHQSASEGVEVTSGPLRVVLPPSIANGIRGSQIPRNEGQNAPPWDMTPGHTILTLEGYHLQGKSHLPQIYVYPAQGYAEMVPGAFESIRRLDNIFGNPGAPTSVNPLPTVPFFNTQQAFASNIQILSFQNGRGVRFLTEYAQYPISANNQDLFYSFQGLSSDGTYYIIVILPISSRALAETSDPGAVLPSGGIPYPDLTSPNADMPGYYSAVTTLLNSAPQAEFTPTLSQLDLLIQSMRIIP